MNQTVTRTEHQQQMDVYVTAGVERAMELGNRGPIRFDDDGKVAQDILDAYWRTGFYVFEDLVDPAEIALLRTEFDRLIDGAPVDNGANEDRLGRPAIGQEFARDSYILVKPLSDPWGGTKHLGGRHPHKMTEPEVQGDAPAKVVFLISGMCQLSEPALRLYGHHDVLAIAEAVNGVDFVPYNDATFVKAAGLGGSVAWHQDGVTHWDNPDWDEGIHGFNFQVQLYDCTPHNCLWVLAGTHKEGKADITGRVAANGGSEYLPEAVPLICKAGDVTIANRQVIHGSFANTSENQRISITFGFHRYSSVLGAKAALSQEDEAIIYDEERIDDRAGIVQLAIDARQQFYPNEPRFAYQRFEGREDQFQYNAETRETLLRNYNLKDLSI